jgi:hypothetical protein
MSRADERALAGAIVALERQTFAAKIADYAGAPIARIFKALPKAANDKIQDAVNLAMLQCLKVAVKSLDGKPAREPRILLPKLMSGLAGGLSGFVGFAALPIELPITTTNILRSIAEIARSEGEDMSTREAQLACLEVFALGQHSAQFGTETGYYATRALLAKATGDIVSSLLQRGVAEESASLFMRFITEIAARFSIVVSERAAASTVPVIGALGGASINWVFTDYFQQIARGHFAIRRLERLYGTKPVQAWYREVVRRLAQKHKS